MNSLSQSSYSLNFDVVGTQAQGLWRQILPGSGVPEEYLNNQHGPCPACGGRDRFRFDDKDGSGSFYCNQCGAGDGFELLKLVHKWTAREALKAVASFLSLNQLHLPVVVAKPPKKSFKVDTPPVINERVRRANAALWSGASSITPGDAASVYLKKVRGIDIKAFPHGLRLHHSVGYFGQDKQLVGYLPALLAQVVDTTGTMVAVHKTYLTEHGQKAPVPEPKKLSRAIYPGATQGAAIRLFEAEEVLAVAEGIETALAVHLLADEYLPVWATATANGLESLVIPASVNRLIIAADNDVSQRGKEAAERLATRQTARGVMCQIVIPEQIGQDWADVLQHEVSNHGNQE